VPFRPLPSSLYLPLTPVKREDTPCQPRQASAEERGRGMPYHWLVARTRVSWLHCSEQSLNHVPFPFPFPSDRRGGRCRSGGDYIKISGTGSWAKQPGRHCRMSYTQHRVTGVGWGSMVLVEMALPVTSLTGERVCMRCKWKWAV
jgi:hypothetical protein